MPTPRPTATAHPVLCEDQESLSLAFEDGIVQSRMSTAEPLRLLVEYTRLMMAFLLFVPEPRRIAMIGLGGGSLAKYCRAHLPAADFTAIEIAAEVIRMRSLFAIPADGPQFRVLCADGADYLRATEDLFDVLLVDAFCCGGQPERVGRAAFYDDCAARLDEGGVLVVNLHSDDDDYGLYVRRIHTAFKGKIVVTNADDSENRVVFASQARVFPPSREQLIERLRRLEPHHPVDLEAAARKILKYTSHQPPPF
ncbi:MAG TPA: transferase [Terriglobales bacterium]|nr:transferase [Terriglobales bacterium]